MAYRIVKTENHQKEKMQFSQKICVYSLFLVTAAVAGNFVLSWFGKELLSDVTVAIITTFGGFVTVGYFALSGVRDCSLNKWVNSQPSTNPSEDCAG